MAADSGPALLFAHKAIPAVAPHPAGGTALAATDKTPGLLVNPPYLQKMKTYHLRGISRSAQTIVREFRHGCEIIRPAPASSRPPPKRGDVTDMSKKSRLRAAFDFSNAPNPWGVMITLTFQTPPADPKRSLRAFRVAMRDWIPMDCQWGWVMEFTRNEIIHFHLFVERRCLDARGFLVPRFLERVIRHGKPTDLVRGPFDVAARSAWLESIPNRTEAAERFNRGGIVELLRTPDAAARYIAKEAGKRAQKTLPEGIAKAGLWWWLSPAGKPRVIREWILDPRAASELPEWRRVFDKKNVNLPFVDDSPKLKRFCKRTPRK